MVLILGWGECRGGVALTRRAGGEKKRTTRRDDLLYVELHCVEERPHESEADTVQAAALGWLMEVRVLWKGDGARIKADWRATGIIGKAAPPPPFEVPSSSTAVRKSRRPQSQSQFQSQPQLSPLPLSLLLSLPLPLLPPPSPLSSPHYEQACSKGAGQQCPRCKHIWLRLWELVHANIWRKCIAAVICHGTAQPRRHIRPQCCRLLPQPVQEG
jgi:hypothetical protein